VVLADERALAVADGAHDHYWVTARTRTAVQLYDGRGSADRLLGPDHLSQYTSSSRSQEKGGERPRVHFVRSGRGICTVLGADQELGGRFVASVGPSAVCAT
jgi:hypothetical protein